MKPTDILIIAAAAGAVWALLRFVRPAAASAPATTLVAWDGNQYANGYTTYPQAGLLPGMVMV